MNDNKWVKIQKVGGQYSVLIGYGDIPWPPATFVSSPKEVLILIEQFFGGKSNNLD